MGMMVVTVTSMVILTAVVTVVVSVVVSVVVPVVWLFTLLLKIL
jgi:hypothetical protein